MRKTLEGIGKRNVRKAVSITPELEMVLTELSNATGNKMSVSEIMSILLHEALMKSEAGIRWFEQKYVDTDEYRVRIMYSQKGTEKTRVVRSERKV